MIFLVTFLLFFAHELVCVELPFAPCFPQRHSVSILQSPEYVFPRKSGYPVLIAFETTEQNLKIEVQLRKDRKLISRSALFIIDKPGRSNCTLDIHIPDFNMKEQTNDTHKYFLESRLLSPAGSLIAADSKEVQMIWGIKPISLPPIKEIHPNSQCRLLFELDSLHLLTEQSIAETFSLTVSLQGRNAGKLAETTVKVSPLDTCVLVLLKLPPTLDFHLDFTAILYKDNINEILVFYTSANDFVEEKGELPDVVSQFASAFRLVVLLSTLVLNYRL